MKHLIAPFLLSLICSSSVFASAKPTRTNFGGSTNSIPSFDGGGIGTIPSFGGSTTPLPSFGGSPTGTIPSFGPKPGTNPVSIDPDLLNGSGRNPRNPFLLHTGTPTIDLSSILKGGNHTEEATSSLIEGNYYSADHACLKAAQGTTDGIGFDDASIDAFRDPSYAAQYETKKALEKIPANLMQRFKPKARTILSPGNPCTDTTERQMCRTLLGKSITDPRQANYKPSSMSSTTPTLSAEVEQSKEIASAELDRAVEAHDTQEAVTSTPTPADRTVLVIVMIDKALAAGDKVGAEGALALLREINPSAAHALDCLGVMTFNTREAEDKSPLNKKEKIGPITGFDYAEDLEHRNPLMGGAIAAGEFLGLEATKAVIVKVVDAGWTAVTGHKIFETEANRQALMKQEYKDYIACKGGGGHGCDQVWPVGAEMDKRGENGKDVFTGGDLHKKDESEGGPEHHVIDLSPLPDLESLHSGPSIGPAPERPVVDNIQMEDDPFISRLKSKKDREELIKNRDPHAAENYCQSVVNNFKSVHNKGLSLTPFEGTDGTFVAGAGKKAGLGGGIMAFDSWNDEFWGSMEDYTSKLPGAQNKKNSCNSADPVKP